MRREPEGGEGRARFLYILVGGPLSGLGNGRHALGTKPEQDFRRFRAQPPCSRRGGGQRSGICWTFGSYLKTRQLLCT